MTPAVFVAIILLVIIARGGNVVEAWPLAWAVMALIVAINLRRLVWRERYLLVLATTIAGLVIWIDPNPKQNLSAALNQGAFLMAFVVVLGILRAVADTSPSIASLGAYLTQQPTGRRYSALYLGTGIMQVLFNIGVVSFLIPLIQRGIEKARPNDPLNPVREQRQVTAMQRGFAWGVVWSPTALAPLALFELLPGVDRLTWIGMGLCVFLALLVVGRIEDTIRFRSYRPAMKIVAPVFPRHAAMGFIATCTTLLGLAEVVAWIFDETIVFGLLTACPILTICWIVVQSRGLGMSADQVSDRLKDMYHVQLAQSGNLAIALACSGFMGRAAGLLVPSDALADVLRLHAMPDWILLSALPVVLCAFSSFGFSPLMMAIFFGSLFGGMTELPTDATQLALAISCGWGLAMTASPFATVILMINRLGNISIGKLTYGWNGVFSVLSILSMTVIFYALAGVS
jgi:hypothetical protein